MKPATGSSATPEKDPTQAHKTLSGQPDRCHARPDRDHTTPAFQHPHLPLTALLSMCGRRPAPVPGQVNERLPPTAAGGSHHGVTVRGGGDRPRRAAALRGGRPRKHARQRQRAGTPRPGRAAAGRRTGGSSRPSWCREAFGARRGGEGGLRGSSRVGCTGAGRVGRPARPSRATACPARRACSAWIHRCGRAFGHVVVRGCPAV